MQVLVNTAVKVPVNLLPLIDDTDFKTIEDAVAYNASGMDLRWNFVTPAGVVSSTAVTPTTSGIYDWTHKGDGMYEIEIPATEGVSANNETLGTGWFSGKATGVLPWRGPEIEFTNEITMLHTGSDEDAGTVLKSLVEGVPAGTIVRVGPGEWKMPSDATLTIPAGVSLVGAGRGATNLGFQKEGGIAVLLSSNCRVASLSISTGTYAFNSHAIGVSTGAVVNAVIDDIATRSQLEVFACISTSACTFHITRSVFYTPGEWGMALSGAAHKVFASDLFIITDNPAGALDPYGIELYDGAMVYGERINILPTTTITPSGAALSIDDDSQCHLIDSNIAHGRIYVKDADATVRLTNCEFDRSQVYGETARIFDIASPLRPTTPFRTLGVEADGDLTKVNTLDGHTPQTGDSYPIASSGTHGNAALKTLIDDVPTVAEFNARTLAAASYATAAGQQVSPFLVAKDHSWRFDRPSQVTAPNLITEVSGFDDLLLEMDFTGALSGNASISTIDAVTVTDETGKTEPTIVSSAKSADAKKVHITTDGASATANSTGYTYSVTVTTTDGQTIVRKGRLVVQ